MLQMLDLSADEQVTFETKGDYWSFMSSMSGVFQVTNKRFAFRPQALLGTAKTNAFEVNLADIDTLSKCCVGPGPLKFIPTGLRVKMKNGEKYICSIMKREQLMTALEQSGK